MSEARSDAAWSIKALRSMLNSLSFRWCRDPLACGRVDQVEDAPGQQDGAQRQSRHPEPRHAPLPGAGDTGRYSLAMFDPDVVGNGLSTHVGLPADRATLLVSNRPRQVELVEEETIKVQM